MKVTTDIPSGHGRILRVRPDRVEVEVISYKGPRYTHFELASEVDAEPTIVLWPDRAAVGQDFRQMSCKNIWFRVLPEATWQRVNPERVLLIPQRIEFTLTVRAGQRIQVSTEPPRLYGETCGELSDLALTHPDRARLHVIGASIEQRPLVLLRITDQIAANGILGKETRPVILLLVGEHATEYSGEELTRGMLEAVLADDETGRYLRSEFVIDVLLNANPDGNYHGWHQYNAADWKQHNYFDGVDRSWHHEFGPYLSGEQRDASPETIAICQWIQKSRAKFVFTAHSWEGHDGNLGAFRLRPEDAPAEIGAALKRMDDLAAEVVSRFGIGYELYPVSNLCSGHLVDHLVLHNQAIAYTVESHPYHSRDTLQAIGRELLKEWLVCDTVKETIRFLSRYPSAITAGSASSTPLATVR